MSDTRLDIERDKYLEWKEQQREAMRNASVNVLAESTDMPISLSFGMNPKEINNAIPTDDINK